MAFTINTSLGSLSPKPYTSGSGSYPIASVPTWDTVSGDNYNPNWDLTEFIASITAKAGTYAFKQGLNYGYRYIASFFNETMTAQTSAASWNDPAYIGFCGRFTNESETTTSVYFVWVNANSEAAAKSLMDSYTGGNDNNIFGFSLGSFSKTDFFDWEENVDPDYNPGENQGGSSADLGLIYSEDVDFGFLAPIDPNAETPTDDPDTENNHNSSYFRLMQPYLLSGNKWTQFQDLYWYNVDQSGSFWQSLLRTVFEGVSDPLAAIGGLIRLPLSPGTIKVSGEGPVYLGGLRVYDGSRTASAYYVANRYATVRYGLRLKEVFGTYFDYTETDMQLYLPYVNTVTVDPEIVMDSTMVISYIIDVYTGDLLCTLNVSKTVHGQNLNSIVGRWKGNCAMNTIYSRANTQQHMQNLINGSMSGGGDASGFFRSIFGGMMDQKIKTEKIGNISGDSGWMDIQTPYLIIKRHVPLYPDDWRAIKGAEQNATFTVSQLTGYTEFDEIHVHVGGATDQEAAEIERILKTGIIL